MMEFQHINNSQPEDTTSDINQPPQGENTNGLETSTDITGEKESESSTKISQPDENSDQAVITPDASTTSENIGDSENSFSDSQKDDGIVIQQKNSEINNRDNELLLKEKETGLIDQGKKIFKGFQRAVGMYPSNEEIFNNLVKVLNWMNGISKNNSQLYIEDIHNAWDQTKEAWDLIKRLLDEKRTDAQKLQAKQQENERLSNEFNQRISYYRQQINQKNDQIANLKQENQDLEEKLEASRTKLVSALASVNRNTGTHYDGTSDRPQHHVLTGEYKTLKEQYLDPLANSLFTLMATSNPELKQQRREKVNDIKADISAIVLIGGQAIMRREKTSSIELPSGMLNEMLNLFSQKLGIFDIQSQLSQVSELLTKAANLAQGKVQYPVPGKWQEDDFKQAIRELTEKLCQKLHLNFTSLNSDIQTEIQQSINNALIFLQRANLADPPAFLSLEKEGSPFRLSYHEAAKGYDDDGTIIKAIYPVYLLHDEAKVKAIVLTEPLTSTASTTPETLPYNPTSQTLALTGTSSNYSAPETKSTEINEDEKEKIMLQGILKGKRDTLINNVKTKWVNNPCYYVYDKDNANKFLENLLNIEDIKIIEELESAFIKAFDFDGFKATVNRLVS